MDTKISIVMTTYNSSEYIDECIKSILSQTFKEFEFIIIDDGSTDNSNKIIEKYNDSRIKFLSKSHNYIESLNYGIYLAKGKYIVRMDSDDKMLKHRLQTQYNYMESHPDIAVCGSWVETFGSDQKIYKYSENHDELICTMLTGNPLCHPSVIIRKAIINKYFLDAGTSVYNPQYIYAEDYKLWCDIVMKGHKIANIPEVLIRYRCSENQISFMHQLDVAKCAYKIRLEYLNYVTNIIANNQPEFINILNQTISLYNQKKIDFNNLSSKIKPLYESFLKEKMK